MGDKKKSKTKRTPAKKPKASPGRAAQYYSVVDEWGNQWNRCLPLSEETLSEVETQLRITIPADLRKLFLSYNGGKPEKTYFGTRQVEVGIGSVLPIRPATHNGSSFEANYLRMSRSGLPSKLLPFAYDTGNAGIFCLDAESGEIVYWVHDDPQYPMKKVTPSLTKFLSNLDLPPY